MAKENVKKFLEELTNNKELQDRFIAAQKDYDAEGKSEEEVLEEVILPLAKDAGYEFTVSEYKSSQRDAMKEKGISEEELENVSGGGFCAFFGYGKSAGICSAIGTSTGENDSLITGFGFNLCYYVGIGVGGYT